jgi:hypothetical protein
LENEFDRRVEEFNFQTNGNEHDEERMHIIPVSLIKNTNSFNNLFFMNRCRWYYHHQVQLMK